PVAAGGDDLAGDDLHAVESGRGGEVVDLTARDARTAQFDWNLGGGHELDGARLLGRRLGDGDPSGGRRQGGTGAGRQVETVGGTVEDRGPTGQLLAARSAVGQRVVDGERLTGERDDDPFDADGGQVDRGGESVFGRGV